MDCICEFCGNPFIATRFRRYCKWQHRIEAQRPIEVITPEGARCRLAVPAYGWCWTQHYRTDIGDYWVEQTPIRKGIRQTRLIPKPKPIVTPGLLVPR